MSRSDFSHHSAIADIALPLRPTPTSSKQVARLSSSTRNAPSASCPVAPSQPATAANHQLQLTLGNTASTSPFVASRPAGNTLPSEAFEDRQIVHSESSDHLTSTHQPALTMAAWKDIGEQSHRDGEGHSQPTRSSNGTPRQHVPGAFDSSDDSLDDSIVGRLADLDVGTRPVGSTKHRTRRGNDRVDDSEPSSPISQWHKDNIPVEEKYWPEWQLSGNWRSTLRGPARKLLSSLHGNLASEDAVNEDPFNSEDANEGYFSNEHNALAALETAFESLELPIAIDTEGLSFAHMAQLGIHFIFNTLSWLNDFHADLPESGDLYQEEALAVQFYFEYGRALWGADVGQSQSEADLTRIQRLESFFFALRTQNAVRSNFGGDGNESLRQLVTFRQATMASVNTATGEVDPDASLDDLFAALDIRGADTWVTTEFRLAVAQMAFEALDRRCNTPSDYLLWTRPSDAFVGSIARRVTSRYALKLWPEDYFKPTRWEEILHHYIVKLLATGMPRTEVGGNAVQRLDAFLGLTDKDVEEAEQHDEDPSHGDAGLPCTLSHLADADNSCSQMFKSAIELAAHLTEMHEFDEEAAKEIADDCEREQKKIGGGS